MAYRGLLCCCGVITTNGYSYLVVMGILLRCRLTGYFLLVKGNARDCAYVPVVIAISGYNAACISSSAVLFSLVKGYRGTRVVVMQMLFSCLYGYGFNVMG